MKRVLITAGARGIGRAMADAFDKAGFDVWVTDVDPAVLADIPAAWTGIAAHAADEDDMRRVF